MTAKSRANLKAAFQTGDTPDGDDFADLIDSFANLTETSGQTLAGNVTLDGLTATTVSAATTWVDVAKVSGAVSAGSVYADTARISGLVTHRNPYAEAYSDVTAITSIEATATWTVVSAALTAPNASGFTVSGHDVTYTGTVTAKFMVNAIMDVRGSANQQLWLSITKNGTPVSGTISRGRHISLDVANRTMQGILELKTSDIVSMQARVPDGPIASPEVFGVKYMITPVFWG